MGSRAAGSGHRQHRQHRWHGAALGCALVGFVMAAAAWGPAAALLVVLLAAVVATAFRWGVGWAAEDPPATGLERLTDHQLCLTWQHSLTRLRRAGTPEEAAALVRVREACLDEMEARRPAAVRRWIATAAPERDPASIFAQG